jgi:hypothetical protein
VTLALDNKILIGLLTSVFGIGIATYVEVKAHTKQIDMLQDEVKNQKAETRRLYENVGDLVTELMRVNPKAYADEHKTHPAPATWDTLDSGLPLRNPSESSAAAAAAPVSRNPN